MPSHYSNPNLIRKYVALKVEDISDSILEKYLTDGDETLLEDITISRVNEKLYGNINGSNTIFWTYSKPIADINFDKVIDSSDVKVFGWTKLDDPTTKTELSVKSINSQYGIIELTSEPTGFEKMTIDYSYTEDIVDFNLVTLASIYLTGYLFACREFLFLPTRMAIGPFRIMFPPLRTRAKSVSDLPHQRLYFEFLKTISQLIKKPVEVITPEISKTLEIEKIFLE